MTYNPDEPEHVADEIDTIEPWFLKPSEVTNMPWIQLSIKDNDSIDARYTGKWLVFVKKNKIDAAWETIKELLRQKKLGTNAKVSTAKPSPLAFDDATGVICVYANDSRDKGDLARISYNLLVNIDVENINYKEDIVTFLGIYEKNYKGPVCKYTARVNDVGERNMDDYTRYFVKKGVNVGYSVHRMKIWRMYLIKRLGCPSFSLYKLSLSDKKKYEIEVGVTAWSKRMDVNVKIIQKMDSIMIESYAIFGKIYHVNDDVYKMVKHVKVLLSENRIEIVHVELIIFDNKEKEWNVINRKKQVSRIVDDIDLKNFLTKCYR